MTSIKPGDIIKGNQWSEPVEIKLSCRKIEKDLPLHYYLKEERLNVLILENLKKVVIKDEH
ncbi:MAG: hypothetical protein U9P79_08870 [Candidatus Cloacimonadota bacterium]|nr:hypothetical protein [Candidatus Cloacimonadota bacterium]